MAFKKAEPADPGANTLNWTNPESGGISILAVSFTYTADATSGGRSPRVMVSGASGKHVQGVNTAVVNPSNTRKFYMSGDQAVSSADNYPIGAMVVDVSETLTINATPAVSGDRITNIRIEYQT